ncbi:hypothetical protein D2Q93_02435 [Alicyclobacillaceae bacterium I2511]|nr:hypothetical protein D2Q93_02435 [Alicyclobacillaceae bacterium I2511]
MVYYRLSEFLGTLLQGAGISERVEDLALQTHLSSFEHVHSPLLSSVVHQSFARATLQLGCRPLERTEFIQQVRLYLLEHPKGLGENDADYARMWQSVLQGHVLAVEPLPEGPMIFLVRSRLRQSFVDWRLRYQRDTWTFQGITSVHQFPWYRHSWLAWSSAVAAVLIAGWVGFAVAPRGTNLNRITASQWAQQHGYVLEPVSLATALPKTLAQITGPTASVNPVVQTPSSSVTNSKGSSGTTKAGTKFLAQVPQALSFQLQMGMSLHDMSLFLAAHHLVPSAVWFDMQLKNTGADKDVHPGTYVFHTHMTTSQLIQVIRSGPKP